MGKYLTDAQFFELCDIIEKIPPSTEQTDAIAYLTQTVMKNDRIMSANSGDAAKAPNKTDIGKALSALTMLYQEALNERYRLSNSINENVADAYYTSRFCDVLLPLENIINQHKEKEEKYENLRVKVRQLLCYIDDWSYIELDEDIVKIDSNGTEWDDKLDELDELTRKESDDVVSSL